MPRASERSGGGGESERERERAKGGRGIDMTSVAYAGSGSGAHVLLKCTQGHTGVRTRKSGSDPVHRCANTPASDFWPPVLAAQTRFCLPMHLCPTRVRISSVYQKPIINRSVRY